MTDEQATIKLTDRGIARKKHDSRPKANSLRVKPVSD